MKKLIIFLVLAGGGFLLYKSVFATSGAYLSYQQFADALLYQRWEEARKLACGEQAKELIAKREKAPRFEGLRSVVHMGPTRAVESETSSTDGKQVTLRVTQEERSGSTTMAPIGPPTVRHHQTAVLVATADGWKVEEFKEEIKPLSDR